MSSARDTVIRNVRRSLNRSAPLSPTLRAALEVRLRQLGRRDVAAEQRLAHLGERQEVQGRSHYSSTRRTLK